MNKILFVLGMVFLVAAEANAKIELVCENKCPPDKPLRIYNCECVDCNYPGVIYPGASVWTQEDEITYHTELKKCFNRENDGWFSVLKKCPNDLPLKTKHGCMKCEEINSVANKEADCDVCQNRTYKNGLCYLTKCPDSDPLRENYTNRCLSCEKIHCFVDAAKNECAKCPNLKYDDKQKRCIEIGTNGVDCVVGYVRE